MKSTSVLLLCSINKSPDYKTVILSIYKSDKLKWNVGAWHDLTQTVTPGSVVRKNIRYKS